MLVSSVGLFVHELGRPGATGPHGGYWFWSGIGSDLGELSIVIAVVSTALLAYRKHECHIHRCRRLAWHPDPEHGHPVCKRHHPDHGTAKLAA